jgi:hypothetical protein
MDNIQNSGPDEDEPPYTGVSLPGLIWFAAWVSGALIVLGMLSGVLTR